MSSERRRKKYHRWLGIDTGDSAETNTGVSSSVSRPLEIPDFAFYNAPAEAVHPRMVDSGLRVKFHHLKSLYQPTERPSTGGLRWEDVSVPGSSVILKRVKEEAKLTTVSPSCSLTMVIRGQTLLGALTDSLR